MGDAGAIEWLDFDAAQVCRLRSERLHVAVVAKVDDYPFAERLERSEFVDLLRADALNPLLLTSARIVQAQVLIAAPDRMHDTAKSAFAQFFAGDCSVIVGNLSATSRYRGS
jgi:hypothetical protein